MIQGTGNSSPYGMVLDATGRPAVDAAGKRMSPFSGGGVLGGGLGVRVSPASTRRVIDWAMR